MINTQEEITCRTPHLEGYCEDCDARYLSRLNLAQIEDRFSQGRVSRNQLDAYRWVWALLSPAGSNPHWKNQPYVTDPDVRRTARKFLRVKGFAIPRQLREPEFYGVPGTPSGDGDATGGGPYLPGSAIES
jgi:hypothetical protein